MEVLESNRASANRGYWWGRVNHWNPASGNSEAHTLPSFFILRHSHLIPPISHLIPIISYPKTHVVPSTLYCEVLLGFMTPLHQQALSKLQVTKVIYVSRMALSGRSFCWPGHVSSSLWPALSNWVKGHESLESLFEGVLLIYFSLTLSLQSLCCSGQN